MRIAVVGSGVAGLAATWALNEHSPHQVHLFEADRRPGGHANTVKWEEKGVSVDTGFMVFNSSTYPNFLRFLSSCPTIQPRITPTEMTLSVTLEFKTFKWFGDNVFTVFADRRRLLHRWTYRILYDIVRFNATALKKVRGEESMGEFLDREQYCLEFWDNYLIPVTSYIRSTQPFTLAIELPARTLLRFMENHGLLQITGKPNWLTLRGGSKVYVDRILSRLPRRHLHLNTPIQSLRRTSSGKFILNNLSIEFDKVILATHSNQALEILRGEEGWEEEKDILKEFRWNERNVCVLHSDPWFMPEQTSAWGCWNYLPFPEYESREIASLTYGMNTLQHLPLAKHGPLLVTLNPPYDPYPKLTHSKHFYAHPVIDASAIVSQYRLHEIQGKKGIYFVGAWTNFGSHEDGFTSGLLAASALPHVSLPFEIELMPGSSWEGVYPYWVKKRNKGLLGRLGTWVIYGVLECLESCRRSSKWIRMMGGGWLCLTLVRWIVCSSFCAENPEGVIKGESSVDGGAQELLEKLTSEISTHFEHGSELLVF